MGRHRAILPGLLGAGVCGGLMCGCLALAGDLDSRFDISPDGANVDFDVRDTARRDVLSRLFDGTGIEIRWVNPSFADERISGQFSGTASAVARQLLARTNFVLVHDGSDQASRVVRVVIRPGASRPQGSRRFQPPYRRPARRSAHRSRTASLPSRMSGARQNHSWLNPRHARMSRPWPSQTEGATRAASCGLRRRAQPRPCWYLPQGSRHRR
jgi:hypothetical protein